MHPLHGLQGGYCNDVRNVKDAAHLRADPPFREVVPKVGNAEGLEGQGCVPQPLQDGVDARVGDRVVPEIIGLQLLLQFRPDPLDLLPVFAI